jgi:endonuclease YncB( thermonuclease family)
MSLKFLFLSVLCLYTSVAFAKTKDAPIADFKIEKPHSSDYEALVLERVIDGDTFVASGKKIRMWGINAPEKDEPLYLISTKALALFLEGELKCKLIDFDRYQRSVMHCLVNSTDIGGLMVKTGYAKEYKKYSGGFYAREEKYAKTERLGVWK